VRPTLACGVLVFCAAVAASAQDDSDPVAKMVRDAEAAKQRQVDRALGAPTKAFEPIERQSPAPPPRPPATWTGQSSIPWMPIACVGGGLVALAVARAVWRWAGRPTSR
jgi:hypothetical protein